MPKAGKKQKMPVLRIDNEVLQQVRQHAHSNSKAEICGVLIGREVDGAILIDSCIRGINTEQGGAHVTFTQDTWEHIYKIKDRDYPDDRILGWYHSHPGFGVFLSDHDTFIHKNFFSSELQVAWVYDPISEEEGCFGWVGGSLLRLPQLSIVDGKGGEGTNENSRSEPNILEFGETAEEQDEAKTRGGDEKLLRITGWIFSYLFVLLLGIMLTWFFFPHVEKEPMPILVDSQTGQCTAIDLQTRQPLRIDPQLCSLLTAVPQGGTGGQVTNPAGAAAPAEQPQAGQQTPQGLKTQTPQSTPSGSTPGTGKGKQ